VTNRDDIGIFESVRPSLLGLAYRILGSRADAEDAVQDTYLKWLTAEREAITNPAAWLTTACTRRCLDLLRASHRKRVDYVGGWLPEPIQTSIRTDTEAMLDLASSLTTAFLLLLGRLTPKERAAYLLYEIFGTPYAEIAAMLETEEVACRKLVSRAKAHIGKARTRQVTPVERQDELLAAFHAAITTGTPGQLAALLSDDIRLTADGGGKVRTIDSVLSGKSQVLPFLVERLHEWWQKFEWSEAVINGTRGLLLSQDGVTIAAVSFAYDDANQAADIFIVRNPDKLSHLEPAVIH
jgi:RNA polymerase sigma-70 factor (ECF subfamily)